VAAPPSSKEHLDDTTECFVSASEEEAPYGQDPSLPMEEAKQMNDMGESAGRPATIKDVAAQAGV
jgi:hypothetical protein